MVSLTLSVSDELKTRMEGFSEINWSEVARQAITKKVEDMEFLKKFTENSKMTEKDALKLGASLNRRLAKKYRSEV